MANQAGPGGGKGAIVTGAASGIGRAAACALMEDGYAVTAIDLNAAALADLQAEAQAEGWTLSTAALDVRDRAAIAEVCQQACAGAAPLAAFVHSAGITWRGSVMETDDTAYERIVSINLTGSFICLTEAARALLAQGSGGSIVAITSVNALRPLATQAVYSAAKAAVQVLVQTLAVELGGAGIRVNAIAPGAVDTPMNPGIRENETLPKRLPLGRIGTPVDISAAVRFLVSEGAGYVTGATLVVDGGLMQVRTV